MKYPLNHHDSFPKPTKEQWEAREQYLELNGQEELKTQPLPQFPCSKLPVDLPEWFKELNLRPSWEVKKEVFELPRGFTGGWTNNNPCDWVVLDTEFGFLGKNVHFSGELPYFVGDRIVPFVAVALRSDGEFSYWVNPVIFGGGILREIPAPQAKLVLGWYVVAERNVCSFNPHQKWLDGISLYKFLHGYGDKDKELERLTNGKVKLKDSLTSFSLDTVYEFVKGVKLDKGVRDEIIEGGLCFVMSNLQKTLNYCQMDVVATHVLFQKALQEWDYRDNSPVSIYGAIARQSEFLPVTDIRDWVKNLYNDYDKWLGGNQESIREFALGYAGRESEDFLRTFKPLYRKGDKKKDTLKPEGITLQSQALPMMIGARVGGREVVFRKINSRVGHWFYKDNGETVTTPSGNPVSRLICKEFTTWELYAGFLGLNAETDEPVPLLTSNTEFGNRIFSELFNWNKAVTYRKRLAGSLTDNEYNPGLVFKKWGDFEVVIPQVVGMGCLSGRKSDGSWLTFTARPSKVQPGTEILCKIQVPSEDWLIVSIDFDS